MKVAVLQLNSRANKPENLSFVISLIQQAASQKAVMCFLPEGFAHISSSNNDEDQDKETIEGPFISKLREVAQKEAVWLSLGGQSPQQFIDFYRYRRNVANLEKQLNTHIIINDRGEIEAAYDKVHLFNLSYGEKQVFNEAKTIEAGNKIPQPVATPIGKVGLSVCYDLRFPEFYRLQMQQGAEILTVPAAFTKVTGEAHWEILLRCRAIENQCFVIAAAQTGSHGGNRQSYGHSLVIDPWGKILLDMGDKVGVEVVDIDLDLIRKVKQMLPALENIRSDLYQTIQTNL